MMAEVKSSRVKVPSLLTVVSSKPTAPGRVHKFTALDHAMGFHTGHIVFYYRRNPIRDGASMENDLDNLRISLSELLCLYPPVTGRLGRGADGNWEVKCNDAGVRMLKANVCATLDEWLRYANAAEERDLTVWEDLPDDPHIWSPFRIQINDFNCGGLAVAISFTHMHADFTSATLLIKSWAEIHRHEPVAHPPIFNLPSVINESAAYRRSSSMFSETNSEFEIPSVRMGRATFKFSEAKIRQCLSKVHESCPDATPFDVLAALFWSKITRLKSPACDDDNKCSLSMCIDLRKRERDSIPYGYFGNALHFSKLSVNAEELQSDRLAYIAGLVHQHVGSIRDEEFWANVAWLESHKKEGGQYPPPFQLFGCELTCLSMENTISSEGSFTYAAMFKQNEKPIHVSYHIGNVGGEGLILVMPSPEEGLARIVMVTLPEEQIVKLCEDQTILGLQPSMLLNGKQ
ncbi:protein ECERIFERUM 2-like [Coffea arabica]|uniref:Protein ECERIFERUM 2-like n=1 Tax=Coffea arabica TaxID=13443 RepID=A0A6P6VW89_COFAR|nr:protein ECERIFERUM 26-like [Coffea arabica]